jgi:hypothetical protein
MEMNLAPFMGGSLTQAFLPSWLCPHMSWPSQSGQAIGTRNENSLASVKCSKYGVVLF